MINDPQKDIVDENKSSEKKAENEPITKETKILQQV
jgi:hypothetical protein